MENIKEKLARFNRFIKIGIWDADFSDMPFIKQTAYQSLKVGLLASRHFRDDNLQLRASALTFFTLLSIVPVLAMAFGLAKGFGLDEELEKQMLENFQGQQEVLSQSLEFAKSLLDSTKGGLVAGIGLVFLFYSVMKLLNNIEISFNDIWYVKQHRTIARKITDYLTIMLLGPILMVLANSLTIFIASEISELTKTVSLIGLFEGIIFPLLRLLPFIVVWALFTLIYLIMPNTNVKFKSAIIAGIVAGTAFQLVQWGLLKFGVNVSKYNAIYGSFAALPLFLFWLQLSWLIVLIGSEISYAVQNVNSHEPVSEEKYFSIISKKKLALSISLLVIRNFKEGLPPLTLAKINEQIKASDKVLRDVAQSLIKSRILVEIIQGEDNDIAYQPAQDTDRLDVFSILQAFEKEGRELDKDTEDNELISLTNNSIKSIDEIISKSKENKLLKTM